MVSKSDAYRPEALATRSSTAPPNAQWVVGKMFLLHMVAYSRRSGAAPIDLELLED